MTTLVGRRQRHRRRDLLGRFVVRSLSRRAPGLTARRGHPMAVLANDEIGITINQFGDYEAVDLAVLDDFVEPLREQLASGVALDIGANVGTHTLWLSQRVHHVHAFEPSPLTSPLLELNTQWTERVTTHRLGLSDHDGTAVLVDVPGNWGATHIARTEHATGSEVDVRTLDGLGLPLDGLCLVKLDVELYEAAVLRGAEQTIRTHQPLVVLEQHVSEFDGDETEAIRLLRSWGYEMVWFVKGSRSLTPWRRRIVNLAELVRGSRRIRLESGPTVPTTRHDMLVAVPPRFRGSLGLDAA